MRPLRHGKTWLDATTLTVLVAVTSLTAAACNPIFGAESGPVRHATITSESGVTYRYQGDNGTVTATLNEPTDDGNIREVFWDTNTPFYDDQQMCTTWQTTAGSASAEQGGGHLLQPGLAMRIAKKPGTEGLRGIILTENIWYAGVWMFNVLVWDSTNLASPLTGVASFDLSSIVGSWLPDADKTLQPPPWRVCARTQADTFAFKAWTGTNPEPAWNDQNHVFITTLPNGWDYAGYSGNYIGHLHPGQWATFSDFTSGPLCLAPDMIGTPQCQAPATTAPSSTSLEGPPAP